MPQNELFMFINAKRVFYAGLAGRPVKRQCGALGFYVSLDGPFSIIRDGRVETHEDMATIPPYAVHSLGLEASRIIAIGVEPETLDPAAMRAWLGPSPVESKKRLAERARRIYRDLCAYGEAAAFSDRAEEFDAHIFGVVLPPRRLDARVQSAIDRLNDVSAPPEAAEIYAQTANLSLSRFLHLFKKETGVAFRNFRAWKRARSFLHHVDKDINLAYLAQDIGYPDSTHFSHSIRRHYGLTPRSVFVGSRRLKVLHHAGGRRLE